MQQANTFFIYLNDKMVSKEDAKISVFDRGFRFGDGAFETIRVESGVLYQWQDHISRLEDGLFSIKIKFDTENLDEICRRVMLKNDLKNGFIRIAISRGEGSRGYLPLDDCTPSLVVEPVFGLEEYKDPVDIFVSTVSKPSLASMPVNCKTMQGLSSTLALMEARENNCFESLMLNADEEICEVSSGNIFWFKGDVLYTPSLDCGLLAGTIRKKIIEIFPGKVVADKFHIEDIEASDEVLITNSSWLAVPVKKLMPNNKAWQSFAKTAILRDLILKDIKEYANKNRT